MIHDHIVFAVIDDLVYTTFSIILNVLCGICDVEVKNCQWFGRLSGQHQLSYQNLPVLISHEYKPPFSPNKEAKIAVSENFI